MRHPHPSSLLLAALAACAPALAVAQPVAAPPAAQAGAVAAAPQAVPAAAQAPQPQPQAQRCTSITTDGEPTQVTLGKSTVIPLRSRVTRIVVGGGGGGRPAPGAAPAGAPAPAAQAAAPGVADLDVVLLSPVDLFFRGRQPGATNVVLQNDRGACFIKEIVVSVDRGALQGKLAELMPEEKGIQVRSAESSIVLAGEISNALRLEDVMSLAAAYGGEGKKIINLMRVTSPQQVMLEVKIAEVSKTMLDNFGLDFAKLTTSADGTISRVVSGIIGGGPGVIGRFKNNIPNVANIAGAAIGAVSGNSGAATASFETAGRRASMLGIDAQKKDGLVRVLAEPNIMAISGQQASFLSGGKVFIPVAKDTNGTGTTITLEEKEFGIGVKFTPTVLGGGRIHLKMISEVSDLSQTGSPFTTVGGATSVLPSMSVRRADTSVQLNDGQSLVIAGLIKNNMTEAIKRFPGLGEVPVVGALARSNEFQTDQTELLFVITPRLVQPMAEAPRLPTDNHVPPSRAEVYLNGSLESMTPAPAAHQAPAAPAPVAPTPMPAAPAAPASRPNPAELLRN